MVISKPNLKRLSEEIVRPVHMTDADRVKLCQRIAEAFERADSKLVPPAAIGLITNTVIKPFQDTLDGGEFEELRKRFEGAFLRWVKSDWD